MRAVEALATTVPLFVLVFASAYFVMARSSPGGFSYQLTRTDSLYFTVSTFNTVGFGDTTATSQTGRFVVTVQMILDLLMLGLGIWGWPCNGRDRRGRTPPIWGPRQQGTAVIPIVDSGSAMAQIAESVSNCWQGLNLRRGVSFAVVVLDGQSATWRRVACDIRSCI